MWRAGAWAFPNNGLDVELVYTRGGSAAMQALIGGAVDYAATSLDVVVTAYANVGADVRRFAVTGRLPLFALVTAPRTAGAIQSVKALEGKTVAVSGLGNADHALTLYLLKQAGGDAGKVRFATMGVNLLEALRQGQVDAGLVQEPAPPAVALGRKGAGERDGPRRRQEAPGRDLRSSWASPCGKELAQRKPEMALLTKALADGSCAVRLSGATVAALPKVTTGLDLSCSAISSDAIGTALSGSPDHRSRRRLARVRAVVGGLMPDADISGLHDTTIVGSCASPLSFKGLSRDLRTRTQAVIYGSGSGSLRSAPE